MDRRRRRRRVPTPRLRRRARARANVEQRGRLRRRAAAAAAARPRHRRYRGTHGNGAAAAADALAAAAVSAAAAAAAAVPAASRLRRTAARPTAAAREPVVDVPPDRGLVRAARCAGARLRRAAGRARLLPPAQLRCGGRVPRRLHAPPRDQLPARRARGADLVPRRAAAAARAARRADHRDAASAAAAAANAAHGRDHLDVGAAACAGAERVLADDGRRLGVTPLRRRARRVAAGRVAVRPGPARLSRHAVLRPRLLGRLAGALPLHRHLPLSRPLCHRRDGTRHGAAVRARGRGRLPRAHDELPRPPRLLCDGPLHSPSSYRHCPSRAPSFCPLPSHPPRPRAFHAA